MVVCLVPALKVMLTVQSSPFNSSVCSKWASLYDSGSVAMSNSYVRHAFISFIYSSYHEQGFPTNRCRCVRSIVDFRTVFMIFFLGGGCSFPHFLL